MIDMFRPTLDKIIKTAKLKGKDRLVLIEEEDNGGEKTYRIDSFSGYGTTGSSFLGKADKQMALEEFRLRTKEGKAQIYRVYLKRPGIDKTYRPVDTNTGAVVGNLIYATFFEKKDLHTLKSFVKANRAKGIDMIIKTEKGTVVKV